MTYIAWFKDLGLDDLAAVGGKNASLGQMIRELSSLGVKVPDGFAVTTEGYRAYLGATGLRDRIAALLEGTKDVDDLTSHAQQIRQIIFDTPLPAELASEILAAYHQLCADGGFVAVRSSATAEDLPNASFAGQQESFLYIQGDTVLLDSVKRCFASLFTARAISYRRDMNISDAGVALSVGVQRMVRADTASSGVMFTLDPDTGFRDVVLVTAAWGLGENVVQGRVEPDEYYVHKPTLARGFSGVVRRKAGAKEAKLVYQSDRHRLANLDTRPAERQRLCLHDDEVVTLARWAITIEEHYSKLRGKPTPMDLEWAKDGETGELFIVQARPETVYSQRGPAELETYRLRETGEVLGEGIAIGSAIGSGAARVIASPEKIAEFQPGEVLITDSTDPDWEPVMKIASAIVTQRGGRTSHAAIVAREMGIPAVVGMNGAMTAVPGGADVTVSCAEGPVGHVYRGALPFDVERVDPRTLPATQTKVMLNLAQPDQAFALAHLPVDGVGLARMEFIFAGWVGVHPLALTRYDSLPYEVKRQVMAKTGGATDRVEFFVDRLSQGIATLAAAFYPKPVILRFSDFKTNEYAHLVGGEAFEPHEENPMIGWRGASRYYHPEFREGFLLEVEAVKRVREVLGLTNLKVMIPFCRTPEEGQKVLDTMAAGGLVRGASGLEVYVMAEIPANVFLADRFAELFDGFSIGSNDLTQLCLGVDRDSERIAPLFDERNEAVKRACVMLIEKAHAAGRPVGICGQAPSDYPDFAAFLVEHGIDSLSLAPDAVVATRRDIANLEPK